MVTLRGGGAWVGRVSESILAAIGLPELIGANEQEYLAIALASDAERRASLRRGLRAKVEASPLCDAERFTRNLEAALRAMWGEWRGGNTGQTSP